MSKLVIRLTIIGVALYMILYYAALIVAGVDIWSQSYYLLFEFCICLCISEQGKFHCKYLKWTAYSILFSDTIVCIDNIFDVFPVNFMIFVPVAIILLGLLTTTSLAIWHYIRVRRIKQIAKQQNN